MEQIKNSKSISIMLWILQVVLGVWSIIGGIYIINNYKNVGQVWALNALPNPVWITIGVLQALFSLGLVLPGALKILPKLTPFSAVGLAVISLLGAVLFIPYSGFPGMLWAIVPAILTAFVAYKRWN